MNLPPFQALLDAYHADVRRFLTATAGPQAAEDCAQETWLAALRAYPRLGENSNLRGWLLTIAHRKAIDHARAARRAPIAVAEVQEEGDPDPEPSRRGGGDDDEELWSRVRQLPDKQRTALALRFVLDAPYGEIAAAMGTSEEAARRSVHEGLKRLRREMSNDR